MGTTETERVDDDLARENERLRARLGALEAELVEVQARANAAVAQWQDRAYWLDRWHVDLNALMRRRGAAEVRGILRGLRSVARFYKRLRRGLRRP
jgi:tetrahydrodipicolinate N-succinyltransferase